jgi:hypothetical protein
VKPIRCYLLERRLRAISDHLSWVIKQRRELEATQRFYENKAAEVNRQLLNLSVKARKDLK